jgi:putative Ca2+/H+ antiporter (TMEM165/GDT1 family)
MDAFFTSTFTVTLAEMGDKTQLLSLLLVTRLQKPWQIIAGILIATLLNHGVSAWFGDWFSQFLTSELGELLIHLSFIAVGLWLLIPDKDEEPNTSLDKYGAFVVSLVLFFIAEIGDKTQIATVLLAAEYQSLLWVTLGTTLGMLLANVPVVFAGNYIMQRIPFTLTRVLAAMAFITIGLYGFVN